MRLKLYLIIVLAFICCFGLPGFGQTDVGWTMSQNKQNKTLEILAEIPDGWHMYSQHLKPDAGPVPTSFVFEKNKGITLTGSVIEPKPIQKFDETFGAMLDYFEGKTLFTQEISVRKKGTITCTVTYMLCDDTMCLPPVDKVISLNVNK